MAHEYGDERMAEWLAENGYHPRSSKHGSASCMFLLDDLLYESDRFREAAKSGDVVYMEDYTVGDEGTDSEWNTDLVVGPPKEDIQVEPDQDRPIVESEPETIWLAIDAKSVMTEHQKARRNRQRDINSFADIMHTHHPGAVTGGVLLINTAERFKSPLRDEDDITEHDHIERIVEKTLDVFEDIPRAEGKVSPNVDGVGCVVVEHTNMDDEHDTRLVTEPPAPQRGDITHYRDFLEIIVETFEDRWLIGEPPEITELDHLGDLRAAFDRQVVELASASHDVGEAIEADTLDEELLTDLQDEISGFEALIEEAEREYL